MNQNNCLEMSAHIFFFELIVSSIHEWRFEFTSFVTRLYPAIINFFFTFLLFYLMSNREY